MLFLRIAHFSLDKLGRWRRIYFITFCLLSQGPGASECTTCEAGHYCDSRTTSKAEMIGTKICPAGTHCPPGTLEKPDLHDSTYACWKGHYCLRGDEVQLVGCHKPLTSLNEMSWQSYNLREHFLDKAKMQLAILLSECFLFFVQPILFESIQVTFSVNAWILHHCIMSVMPCQWPFEMLCQMYSGLQNITEWNMPNVTSSLIMSHHLKHTQAKKNVIHKE